MKFYLGVTDNNWYNFLSFQNREDINFWQPGGSVAFKVLSPGEPFLFKLKSPINAIGGVGFFSSHTFLPLSLAWDVFENGNGCNSLGELQRMIFPLRKDKSNPNPPIGCIVLTNPIFFRKDDWIKVPEDWKPSTQQGKSYSTDGGIGQRTWSRIESLLQKYLYAIPDEKANQLTLEEPDAQYGKSILVKVRLGQGAFRVLVTDAYQRKCAISGERTLPVLEAAHIKPYAKSGLHLISNALLLRSDIHKLFDTGYLTITADLKVEVSKRIKEEFENGKEYYRFHGNNLYNLPYKLINKPENRFVEWHNENTYKG
ncbi:MAG: HNH endonuclease [Bacteroidetes bacterium]|nr:MAG: HNH endonuclease [Bacteroidota bacterium]